SFIFSCQGIPSRCSHERQSEDAAEGQSSWISVLFESQTHDGMTTKRIFTIGPQEPIPPRKIKPKIRVCFLRQHGMVYPMHVRRHDHPAKSPINYDGHPDVAMIKHGRRVQHNFKPEHPNWSCAK